MKADEVIKRLEELPGQLRKLEERKFDEILAKVEMEKQVSIIEASIKQKINGEVDDKGKKVYSNESARKAEFERLSVKDSDLLVKKERLAEIEDKLNDISLEYNYLHSTQTNLRAILNYLSKS